MGRASVGLASLIVRMACRGSALLAPCPDGSLASARVCQVAASQNKSEKATANPKKLPHESWFEEASLVGICVNSG